jgi:transposase
LDVHKKSITACVLWAEAKGAVRKEKRRFGTFTVELLSLADWLRACGVTHVALESTGVYWKPVWNILEGQFEIVLVNAQHIKAVPGRKTDQKDSEWIADLLQHGLLRGSCRKASSCLRVGRRSWKHPVISSRKFRRQSVR